MTDSIAAPELRSKLAEIVGPANAIADRDRLPAYERDWTGHWHGKALCAVRPACAEEVAAVLRACGEAGVGVVVQAGNTGLVGGATPFDGEVVLDTTRLDELGEIDLGSRQVLVGAGVTLQSAQEHASKAGLEVAVDLAARSAATIGGMVATNAGGALALRYGTMRASVAGLEAVLADGSILTRLSGLLKDNAGYDLPSLLIGSEGTLAVLTRVRLTLIKRPAHRAVALMGLSGFEQAVDLLGVLRERLGLSLEAAECFDRQGMERVCAYGKVRDPLPEPHPVYLLIQVADDDEAIDRLAEAVEEDDLDRIAVGEDGERQRALWAYRERLNEAVAAQALVRKYDVSVPLLSISGFAAAARDRIATLDSEAQVVIYGHLGDGNLHVNVLDAKQHAQRLDESMLDLVATCEGSISAEHGIGRAKTGMLHPTRSLAEIEAMQAIKQALDPRALLGRGRVLACGLPQGAQALP